MPDDTSKYGTTSLEDEEVSLKEDTQPDSKPIEPEPKKMGKPSTLKWLFFLIFILYAVLSYTYAPILMFLGRYLIVAHEPEKCDLIVCRAGENVEIGLAVADAYQRELAPRIFIAKEEPPDSHELLKEKGLNYPESTDLLINVLKGLGVPRSALFISDRPVKSAFDEAKLIRELVKMEEYRSLIIITSPIHSRRTWLAFGKLFDKEDVRILIVPSQYAKFSAEGWWKEGKYVWKVIIEYEKLIYEIFKYL